MVTPTITLTELGEVDLITEQVLANPRALISLVPTGMEPMTEDFSDPQLLKSKNHLQKCFYTPSDEAGFQNGHWENLNEATSTLEIIACVQETAHQERVDYVNNDEEVGKMPSEINIEEVSPILEEDENGEKVPNWTLGTFNRKHQERSGDFGWDKCKRVPSRSRGNKD